MQYRILEIFHDQDNFVNLYIN